MFGEKHDPEFLKHLFDETEILRKPVAGIIAGYHILPYILWDRRKINRPAPWRFAARSRSRPDWCWPRDGRGRPMASSSRTKDSWTRLWSPASSLSPTPRGIE